MYLPGAFQLALASLKAEPRIAEAFRAGAGVGRHEPDPEVFDGCEMFFAPGYRANLVPSWIPALDGVEAKLQAGAWVADVGCGHGASTIIMAKAYPRSTFTGSDYHRALPTAGGRAGQPGRPGRTRELVAAGGFSRFRRAAETPFNLVYEARPPSRIAHPQQGGP